MEADYMLIEAFFGLYGVYMGNQIEPDASVKGLGTAAGVLLYPGGTRIPDGLLGVLQAMNGGPAAELRPPRKPSSWSGKASGKASGGPGPI
jgi:hypothetical protein